jgi:hypothetical protein
LGSEGRWEYLRAISIRKSVSDRSRTSKNQTTEDAEDSVYGRWTGGLRARKTQAPLAQCPAGVFPIGVKWRIAKSSGTVASVSNARIRKLSIKASNAT